MTFSYDLTNREETALNAVALRHGQEPKAYLEARVRDVLRDFRQDVEAKLRQSAHNKVDAAPVDKILAVETAIDAASQ